MAVLWLIHTILLIFLYREGNLMQGQNLDKDEDCYTQEESAGDHHSLYHQRNATMRERAPSAFFSYVYNGL